MILDMFVIWILGHPYSYFDEPIRRVLINININNIYIGPEQAASRLEKGNGLSLNILHSLRPECRLMA